MSNSNINVKEALAAFDETTLEHIAHALWMDEFDENKIDLNILTKLAEPKNSPAAHGERMRRYIRYLMDHPLSRTPNHNKIYKRLLPYCDELSPQQLYVLQSSFLGPSSSAGYDWIPPRADFKFPRDHLPKVRSKNGWHFFVGSCWDTEGNEYGVELMFFQAAIFPPGIAAGMGLTDDENQVVELQFAISEAGGRHFQAEPVVLGGTSGLLNYDRDPFVFRLGRNSIECHNSDGLFPVTIKAWGLDRGVDPSRQLGVNITFSTGKETLFQGAEGCMPSVDGIGSLYYSIPNLQLDPSCSTLVLDGKTVTLQRGSFWFDHQWGHLAMVGRSTVWRAAAYSTSPRPGGWDWFMAQFTNDRQLTVFASHDKPYSAFYEQTGPTPPGVMTIDVAGTLMGANRDTSLVRGTLQITDWIKAEHSPNPARYAITETWHPNQWNFEFGDEVPEDIRSFVMNPIVRGDQVGFFANGAQYAEGAVVISSPTGEDLGRGFAESVSYANTTKTIHRLAGLPDSDKFIQSVSTRTVPLWLRLLNLLYVITHRKDIEEIIDDSAGLEFFIGKELREHFRKRSA
jgi:predicted secreted hydrolase